MTGQTVGYIRVSSLTQHTDRQLDGLALDARFEDKLSGKDRHRPQLEAMLKHVRAGDTLVVHSMDRLARNLIDLQQLIQDLTKRGVVVKFCKENLTFTGDDSPMSRLLLAVMGGVAQFEREIIRERQREGIELAKRRGVYRGRKKAISADRVPEIRQRIAAGEQKAAIARDLGISRETLYQYLRAEA